MRIAITGAHSTGKTTTLEELWIQNILPGHEFLIEATRKLKQQGFNINESGDEKMQTQVMNYHLNTINNVDKFVTDRCSLDGYCYTKYLWGKGNISDSFMSDTASIHHEIFSCYDLVFYIKPEFAIVDDGVRSTNEEFRNSVADIFEQEVDELNILYPNKIIPVSGSVEERVETIKYHINKFINMEIKTEKTIDEIAGKYLGKSIDSSDHYDPSLLNPIPREENRVKYNILDTNIPFIGYDIWHCYELSFLTSKGFPVNVVAKIAYSADSKYIIESKSLKLYLNSFNMNRIDAMYPSTAKDIVKEIIRKDLQNALGVYVFIDFHDTFQSGDMFKDYINMEEFVDVKSLEFDSFNEDPDILKSPVINKDYEVTNAKIKWNGLRSNCRVTHQPDFGDIYIYFDKAKTSIDISNIIKYIVSFRNESHFHEEVVEMIYKRLWDILQPETLMVGALYTRRGGIDICPIRTNKIGLLPDNWINTSKFVKVNGRQ